MQWRNKMEYTLTKKQGAVTLTSENFPECKNHLSHFVRLYQ